MTMATRSSETIKVPVGMTMLQTVYALACHKDCSKSTCDDTARNIHHFLTKQNPNSPVLKDEILRASRFSLNPLNAKKKAEIAQAHAVKLVFNLANAAFKKSKSSEGKLFLDSAWGKTIQADFTKFPLISFVKPDDAASAWKTINAYNSLPLDRKISASYRSLEQLFLTAPTQKKTAAASSRQPVVVLNKQKMPIKAETSNCSCKALVALTGLSVVVASLGLLYLHANSSELADA